MAELKPIVEKYEVGAKAFDPEKAKAALATYYAGSPDANIEEVLIYWPFRHKEDEERLVGPLRALGMPAKPSE